LGGVHCSMLTEAHLLREMKNRLLAIFYSLRHEVRMQAGCFVMNHASTHLNTVCLCFSNKLSQVIADGVKNSWSTGV